MLLAVGILGATVMPHVIYLHSALTQDRIVPRDDGGAAALRFKRIDIVIAMAIAGLVNVAMLIMAAATFYGSGLLRRRLAREAHRDARAAARRRVEHVFAISLLVSGLS